MTTDDFTEAARAEAEKAWPKQRHGVHVNPSLIRDEMVRMAAWARTYLAEQEPTDSEVLAALNADYAIRFGPRNLPADSLEPYGDEAVRIMRVALIAARAVQRDEEERDG